MLAAFPISSPASAHDNMPNLSVSEIACTVGSEYVFTIPSNITISHPELEEEIGSLGIEDVFLPKGEWLSVSIAKAALEANGDSLATLPYDVVFNPASVITETNIGESYPVVVKIDAQAYRSASSGVYEGLMIFKVALQPYGEVVWIGTTNIAVTKPNTGGGGDEQSGDDEQDDDQEEIVASDDEDQNDSQDQGGAEDPEKIDNGSDGVDFEEGTDEREAVTLGDEGVARAGGQWFALWWWIFATGAIVAVILVLLFFVRRREKDEEE